MTHIPLLIHTGTHGDEWEVIELVKQALEKYKNELPVYEFVPEVSPSAVKAKTRQNAFGNDLNRVFYSDSDDPEVIDNITNLENKKFELFVTFHEDPVFDQYYIYDSGTTHNPNKYVLNHIKKLALAGIPLLNGLDDPDDPDLGFEFKDGYRKFTHKPGEPDNGMLSVWALNRGIIKESLNPEIPGRLEIDKKKYIVNTFFEEVLTKYI